MAKELSDEKLMQAYRNGDPDAFEELYRRHSGKVYAFLRKRLIPVQDQEEVFQTVFAKLHLARDQYDPSYPVLQWLFVLTKTALIDHLRKSRRRVETRSDQPIEHYADLSQTRKEPEIDSELLLGVLTSEQKQIVQLRVMDDFSYEEIARRLQRSEASIRQTFSRALKRLRGAR